MSKLNLVGKTFYELTVIKQLPNENQSTYFLCKCSCGKEHKAKGAYLKAGRIKSCGCLRAKKASERMTKHGHNKNNKEVSGTYTSWYAMKQRCDNPNHIEYPNYGGKGITYTPEWKEFINFLNDMGERPSRHTIERLDNTKNYEPTNCIWLPKEKQVRNTSRTKLTPDLVRYCRTEKAKGRTYKSIGEELNISSSTISSAVLGENWKDIA